MMVIMRKPMAMLMMVIMLMKKMRRRLKVGIQMVLKRTQVRLVQPMLIKRRSVLLHHLSQSRAQLI